MQPGVGWNGPRVCIGPAGGGRLERFVAQITEFPCLLVLGATTTRPDHQPTQPTNAIHPIPLGHQSKQTQTLGMDWNAAAGGGQSRDGGRRGQVRGEPEQKSRTSTNDSCLRRTAVGVPAGPDG